MSLVHHTAIRTDDIATSLRFWCDGLGLEVQMDHRFSGDWPMLFDTGSHELRSVFLGDPGTPDSGILELVDFAEPTDPPSATGSGRSAGFLLVSLFVDVDQTLARLGRLDLGGQPRVLTHDTGVRMAVVWDPNGVPVELVDAAASRNLEDVRHLSS